MSLGWLWEQLVQPELTVGLSLTDLYVAPYHNASIGSRRDIDLSTRISENVTTSFPLINANMQAVVTDQLAQAMVDRGMVVIGHRYFGEEEQLRFVKRFTGMVFGCVGIRDPRAEAELAVRLYDAGAVGVCIETTHADHFKLVQVLRLIKKARPKCEVMVGNIVTYKAARLMIDEGANSLKVGMGPGSPCTTRENFVGVPQATAVAAVSAAARAYDIPVIADGGIRDRGTLHVPIALGAHVGMAGGLFAELVECAEGKKDGIYPYHDDTVECERSEKKSPYGLKTRYYGEASDLARQRRQHVDKSNGVVAEGKDGWTYVKRTLDDMLRELDAGLRILLGYTGCRTIACLHKRAVKERLVHRRAEGYHDESRTRIGE